MAGASSRTRLTGQRGIRQKQIAQVRPRLDPVHRAARQQRDEGRVRSRAILGADKQPGLATYGLAPQLALRGVVVHRQTRVADESLQRLAPVHRVANGDVKRRLLERVLPVAFAPVEESFHHWPRFFRPNLLPFLGRRPLQPALGHEQRLDQLKRLPHPDRIDAQRIEEVLAHVTPAPRVARLLGPVEVVVDQVRVGHHDAAVGGQKAVQPTDIRRIVDG